MSNRGKPGYVTIERVEGSRNQLRAIDVYGKYPANAIIVGRNGHFVVVESDEHGSPIGDRDLCDSFPAFRMFRDAQEIICGVVNSTA